MKCMQTWEISALSKAVSVSRESLIWKIDVMQLFRLGGQYGQSRFTSREAQRSRREAVFRSSAVAAAPGRLYPVSILLFTVRLFRPTAESEQSVH